jgi:three-Cys-motif partner protein
MPKIDDVGFGDCTEIKISDYSKIIAMHMAITKAVICKYQTTYKNRYHYIELTSGKGYTPNGRPGSPIIFLEIAENKLENIEYYADFIECKPKNIEELQISLESERQRRNWKNNNWNFHCGKYQDEVPILLNNRSNELGLIFIDPSGDLPNLGTIQYITEMRPKMEILLYLSSTNIKRSLLYTDMRLVDFINKIGKNNWLVRKPINWDQHKWTFLLGSNAPNLFKDYKSINFYQVESLIGQGIIEGLNFTKKEQFEALQPKLF